MKALLLKRLLSACTACSLLAIVGCSAKVSPDSERKVFGVSVRKWEPQPVYKRTRLVHLPAPIPVAQNLKSSAPLMLPVIHFELTDSTLEEAAKLLGGTARYASYCASSIADQRITLTALGTVDELARKIGKIAKIQTVVDHHNREVRFLAKGEDQEVTQPQLLN